MAKKKRKGKGKGWQLTASQERDVYAIVLGALALFVAVSIFGLGGAAGNLTASALKSVFGIGMYMAPIVLIVWSILFFVERWRNLIVSKGIGLAVIFFSFIAIVHLANPDPFEPSRVGEFGGYAGAVISYALTKLTGRAGAYIILAAVMLIGVVVTAGISLSDYTEELLTGSRKRLASMKNKPAKKPAQQPIAQTPAAAPATSAADRIAETIRIEETKVIERVSPEPPASFKDKTYQFPPLDLLRNSPARSDKNWKKSVNERIKVLEDALRDFGVDAAVARVVKGPTVTRFELQLGSGVKVNRISSLSNDLALALAASDVRILAPIPGKALVGIEVPSDDKEMVTLGDVLSAPEAKGVLGPLMVGIGKDIGGGPFIVNLGHMPHLLIAGATGSGKTTCVNSIITSLLFFSHPDQVKMILIDPKMVELTYYKDIPHLMAPVITNPRQASQVLAWAVKEMERRFKTMADAGARNIDFYNKEKPEDTPVMPYLVIVIDELADLMMVAPAEVEESICRLSQMGRAVGINLVVATQRPSVDVITGLIKANIPSRVSFEVASQTDSRVILDMPGAEKLIGRGDMLFLPAGSVKPKRIQGAYLSEQEITAVTEFVRGQRDPDYSEDILEEEQTNPWTNTDYKDPLLDQAIEVVVRIGSASISMLQRRLRVGYSRAARLVDTMEERGIVSGADGSKPRSVLLSEEEFERLRSGDGQE
jgi:DNA segregation ATPase FtsK/SpoIIIE, S-DNA-T family